MGIGKIIIVAFIFILVLGLSLAYVSADTNLTPPIPFAPTYIDISVEKVHQMLAENPEEICLLDVRTEGEYDAEYIPGAINIPLPDLKNRIDELDRSKTIIVCCKSVGRSRTASETLFEHGFIVYNMLGGIEAWKAKFATSTSTPIPTLTPAVTPSPTVSPALTTSPTPTPITISITPMPEEERRIPGFEVPLAILIFLILSMLLIRKRRGK